MEFVYKFLGTKSFVFLLLLVGEGKTSFGIYQVEKSLTPLGWAVVIIVPIALIFGLIYLAAKFLKKTKIK